MLLFSRWLAIFTAIDAVVAQLTTLSGTSGTAALSGDNVLPTGTKVTYLSLSSTVTLSTTAAIATGTGLTSSLTQLTGGSSTTTVSNSTVSRNATSTSSSVAPTNTQPCNSYLEFCTRKYSNISMIAAHNFPFAKKGNAESNQELSVLDQLNDGVRMLQGQTHYVNKTLYFCHTSCDLLNAGTVLSQFTTIAKWVDEHPYDVVTILIGNGDFIGVGNFTQPIIDSGLERWAYRPPVFPMALDSWPTLSEMILKQKRVVIFMDYNANQTEVPYIMDEFSQLWETPFSPTDPNFPCVQQRPPGLSDQDAGKRLYMANHNLNVQASLLGTTLLVPNLATINQTNAVSGNASLGVTVNTCVANWGRPPNFLLVDYYNRGNVPGSVFQVAASANGVKYEGKCCGGSSSDASIKKANVMLEVMVSLGLILIISFAV